MNCPDCVDTMRNVGFWYDYDNNRIIMYQCDICKRVELGED